MLRLDVTLTVGLEVGCLRSSSHILSMNVNNTPHLTSTGAEVYARIVDSHRVL